MPAVRMTPLEFGVFGEGPLGLGASKRYLNISPSSRA